MNGRERITSRLDAIRSEILNAHHMFGIVLHLLKIAGAAGRDVRSANRRITPLVQDREVRDIVADCVRREGCSSETGDKTQHGDFSELEHTVFQTIRDSNIEDLFQYIPLDLKRVWVQNVKFMFLVV